MLLLSFYKWASKFLILFFVIISITSHAQDIGKQKSSTCVACHGQEGISNNELWPNLAGQKEQYFLKQLKAFHDGTRVDPLMSPIAKMLTDQDMIDLAKYYSQLKGQ